MLRKPGFLRLVSFFWILFLAVIPVSLYGQGSQSAVPPGPYAGSAPTTANLWISTSGGSCTRQATAGIYNSAQACGSMAAAFSAASSGDIIVMKNGTYAAQTVSGSAKTVTFHAETYDAVLVAGLSVSAGGVTTHGIIASGTGYSRGDLDISNPTSSATNPIVIDGFRARMVNIGTATYVTLSHGEFGNYDTSLCPGECDGTTLNGSPTDHITFLRNIFHDIYDHTGGSVDIARHNDMLSYLYTTGGSNQVFDGNIFYNGPDGGSNIMSSGPLSNWTVQNNYFGGISAATSQSYGNNVTYGQGTCTGYFYFRNNVVASGAGYLVNTGGCAPTIDFSGNTVLATGYHACLATGTATGGHNVFVDSAANNSCGSSNKTCTPSWLNGTPSASNGYDIRLASTDSCAKDAGNPSSYSPTDMYGTTRPQGAAPDAGAYEIPSGVATVSSPTNLAAAVQ